MQPEEIESIQIDFATSDGWILKANRYAPPSGDIKAIVLLMPAMGSHSRPARFMASALAKMGNLVVALDPRGHGQSKPHPKRGIDYGFDHILKYDLPAVVASIKENNPDLPIFMIGHSLGGHLSAIFAAENPDEISGVITLTSAHLHSKIIGRPALILFTAFAAISKLFGYLPGQHFGWGTPIARKQVMDWAKWGITGVLRGTDGRNLEPVLATSGTPTLCIGFTDDLRMAPTRSTKAFSELMPAEISTHWEIAPADVNAKKLGHFDHLRTGTVLWERLNHWIDERA
ncbi:hypothetical protein A9Q83_02845 [Alphaproteobacteria bacterium 46_93_T64]|nr:hypothetical protein A9Q83_02845 [Alphaproteobacteria bacterium 46_93_T64]